MDDTRQENGHDIRQIAERLYAFPPPQLRNRDLQQRWHCSQSTVSRLRKTHRLLSDGPEDAHPVYDLLAILGVEKVADPLAAWALGSDDDRKILAAPLLSIEDLLLLDPTLGGHHPETFRRRARAGKVGGFTEATVRSNYLHIDRAALLRSAVDEIANVYREIA